MGVSLDSSVAIAARLIRGIVGSTDVALSVVSVMELKHGVWRAKDLARASLRRQFLDDLIRPLPELQPRHGNRQLETPRAGAARIQKEHAGFLTAAWLMRVAAETT